MSETEAQRVAREAREFAAARAERAAQSERDRLAAEEAAKRNQK
jgi:hypothetical protein